MSLLIAFSEKKGSSKVEISNRKKIYKKATLSRRDVHLSLIVIPLYSFGLEGHMLSFAVQQ
jgi:hypothetical protein